MHIQQMLEAWGRGKAMNNAENGYPHQTPFARLVRNPDSATVKVTSILPEEEHARVDAAVSALKNRGDDRYKAIKFAYVKSMSDVQIGRRLNCSRSSARSLRMRAEEWLAGRLHC